MQGVARDAELGPPFDTLQDWLDWQQRLHPSQIELGLERVSAVWSRLSTSLPAAALNCPTITVGGTNGKGSTVAFLDAILRAAGYRTGVYTSPHLLRYNERIAINGEPVDDADICDAFARIQAARCDISLTYFEFGTLAALDLFARDPALDVRILEVGLGGRLDAVNLIDADVALVTSIGLDHTDWLGDSLEAIAREKAGIFRAGRPAIIGQSDAPAVLREIAEQRGARPMQAGREFHHRQQPGQWSWQGPEQTWIALPPPGLRGGIQYQNAAAALAAIASLRERLPVSLRAIREGLLRARMLGRFTVLPGTPSWILDVAHNPAAAERLAQNLGAVPTQGRRFAVCGMLNDKDPEGLVAALSDQIDHWILTSPPSSRAMSLEVLAEVVRRQAPGARFSLAFSLEAALETALSQADSQDQILVTGSFLSVEAALRQPVLADRL